MVFIKTFLLRSSITQSWLANKRHLFFRSIFDSKLSNVTLTTRIYSCIPIDPSLLGWVVLKVDTIHRTCQTNVFLKLQFRGKTHNFQWTSSSALTTKIKSHVEVWASSVHSDFVTLIDYLPLDLTFLRFICRRDTLTSPPLNILHLFPCAGLPTGLFSCHRRCSPSFRQRWNLRTRRKLRRSTRNC